MYRSGNVTFFFLHIVLDDCAFSTLWNRHNIFDLVFIGIHVNALWMTMRKRGCVMLFISGLFNIVCTWKPWFHWHLWSHNERFIGTWVAVFTVKVCHLIVFCLKLCHWGLKQLEGIKGKLSILQYVVMRATNSPVSR